MEATIGVTPASYGRGTVQVCRRGQKGSILLVALSRPGVRNAFNNDMYEDLIDLLRMSSHDESISAVVLTGVGSYFSSGADVNAFQSAFAMAAAKPKGMRQMLHEPAGRFMMAVIRHPKILAAAVNGPTVGIAMTTLMHCDLVHCMDTATFWAPFTRLALVPEMCSSVTLIESMGLSKANELLLLVRLVQGFLHNRLHASF